ncbi:MAG TPA: hypothetical protein VM802_03170 [Chitinophaga sp.]|uniref:hypothetical protein n=1 Tax=Chitinophaga sp. TaxID=1869181 RepID=UPI002CD60D12|nr:hypothetical protein [Chitinophaga sp.]HVI43836.1 hypothetical protein [Chitinophaga sp.]
MRTVRLQPDDGHIAYNNIGLNWPGKHYIKVKTMQDELNRLLAENESWRLVLKDMEDNNIRFKTKLADILSSSLQRKELEYLEAFQNRFLRQDEQIGMLKHEVKELRTMMTHSVSLSQLEAVNRLQQGMQIRMMLTREAFNTLSMDFSNYLNKKCPDI